MSCEKVAVSQSQLQPLLLKDYLITTDVNNCPQQGRGTLDFKWRGWSTDFLGVLKFSWPRIQPRSSANKVQSNFFCFLEIFRARKLNMGFLGGGLIFGPEIFMGFVGSPKDFLGGFDFCLHSIIPVTWNPEYPHPFWAIAMTYYNDLLRKNT